MAIISDQSAGKKSFFIFILTHSSQVIYLTFSKEQSKSLSLTLLRFISTRLVYYQMTF